MGSIGIAFLREKYEGKTDVEIAAELAKEEGYIVVVRYKRSPSSDDFTNFGTCKYEEEVNGYFSSEYCNDTEILYDGRAAALNVTPDMIMEGSCDKCKKGTTAESLTLMAGNDFYFCANCAKMFCNDCYVTLPLTDPAGGYGMCPDCMIQVQRALPGTFGSVALNSIDKKENSEEEMKECFSCCLEYAAHRTSCPFCGED